MAVFTTSHACNYSSQWTLRHGLLKGFCWARQRMFLCSPSHYSFGYHESNKAWKTHFPFGGWLQVRRTDAESQWVLKRQRSSRSKAPAASHRPALPAPSRVLTQTGVPLSDPRGRTEGASRKLQPKSEVCWSCNYDNYQDMFLLPLTTARSGSCSIPSAS